MTKADRKEMFEEIETYFDNINYGLHSFDEWIEFLQNEIKRIDFEDNSYD